jgi:hypothetical protein
MTEALSGEGREGPHDATSQPVRVTGAIQARQQGGQAFGIPLAKLCHRPGRGRRGMEVLLRPIGRDVPRHGE